MHGFSSWRGGREQAGAAESRATSRATSRVVIALVRGYQLGLSPWVGARCRHFPSCSAYTIEAVERFGVLSGGWLAIKRLGRCHPWGTSGYDPVPEQNLLPEEDCVPEEKPGARRPAEARGRIRGTT